MIIDATFVATDLPGGITLAGFGTSALYKLGYTIGLILALAAIRWVLQRLVEGLTRRREQFVARFWGRQIINLGVAVLFFAILLAIWFKNPSNITTGLGLFSAGLAFALQQVISSIAGYLLILRGNIFSIGDRIDMGGVRGDVIALGFLRTTIMEMGAPPGDTDSDQANAPSWVAARQYTGRIVTVSNNTVFDDPVFNYSRDFPYLWEELHIPIPYDSKRHQAEEIMLAAAQKYSVDVDKVRSDALDAMRRRYFMPQTDLKPAVFWDLTDNWLALTVRFAVPARGIRKLKSDMSREILAGFDEAGIEIASATYDIVGMPPIQIQPAPPDAKGTHPS